MGVASYIVFQQILERPADSSSAWTLLDTVEAATADAAIEQVRKGPGTFVAVLARGFRPRTHYTGPRDTAQPTVIRAIP